MKFNHVTLIPGQPVVVTPHISLVRLAGGHPTLIDSTLDVSVNEACVYFESTGKLWLKDGFLQNVPGGGRAKTVRPDSKRTPDVYLLVECSSESIIKSSGLPVPTIFGTPGAGPHGSWSQIWKVCNRTTLKFSLGEVDYVITNQGGILSVEELKAGQLSRYEDKGVGTHQPFGVASVRSVVPQFQPSPSAYDDNQRPHSYRPPPGGDIVAHYLPA